MIKKMRKYFREKRFVRNFKKIWKEKNPNNEITPVNIFDFPIEKVEIGKYSYGPIIVESWGSEEEKLKIGDFVSIAKGTKFLLGGNHEVETFTTFPFKVKFFGEKMEAKTKGPIIVEDDVWIGTDSIILSGITIGQGAIVGAGSVVTKDVPPYSIVGGNLAKILKYRYSQEIIERMLEIKWNTIDIEKIFEVKEELYKKIDLETLDKIALLFSIENKGGKI